VAIELGYAKAVLGAEHIITVWNTAFTKSGPEDLPFDLRHRRGPLAIELDADAPRADLRAARVDLTDRLEGALRACLGASAGDRAVPPATRAKSVEPLIRVSAHNETGDPIAELTAKTRFFEPLSEQQIELLLDRLETCHPLV
jgi:hypothetical protein